MIQFLTIMLNARRDEEKGATAVEYGLMVALIAIVCILVITALGSELAEKFDETQLKVKESSQNQKQPS